MCTFIGTKHADTLMTNRHPPPHAVRCDEAETRSQQPRNRPSRPPQGTACHHTHRAQPAPITWAHRDHFYPPRRQLVVTTGINLLDIAIPIILCSTSSPESAADSSPLSEPSSAWAWASAPQPGSYPLPWHPWDHSGASLPPSACSSSA